MITPPIFVKIVLMHNQMIFNGTVKIFQTALRIAAPAFLMFVTHAGKGWHTTARDGREGFNKAPMVMGKAQLTLCSDGKSGAGTGVVCTCIGEENRSKTIEILKTKKGKKGGEYQDHRTVHSSQFMQVSQETSPTDHCYPHLPQF
jgi:hypothetical protein